MDGPSVASIVSAASVLSKGVPVIGELQQPVEKGWSEGNRVSVSPLASPWTTHVIKTRVIVSLGPIHSAAEQLPLQLRGTPVVAAAPSSWFVLLVVLLQSSQKRSRFELLHCGCCAAEGCSEQAPPVRWLHVGGLGSDSYLLHGSHTAAANRRTTDAHGTSSTDNVDGTNTLPDRRASVPVLNYVRTVLSAILPTV